MLCRFFVVCFYCCTPLTSENEKSEPFSKWKQVRIFLVWWTNRNAGRTPALRFRLTALFSSSRFPENWYADKIHLPLCTIQFASTFFILSDRGLHFVASTDSKKSPASFPFGLPAGDFHFSAEAPSVHRPQGRKPTLQLQPTKVCFQVFRGLFPAQ